MQIIPVQPGENTLQRAIDALRSEGRPVSQRPAHGE